MESSSKDIKTAASDCSKQFGVNTDPLYKCMNSVLGNSLQHENAYKTEQLNPTHTYVNNPTNCRLFDLISKFYQNYLLKLGTMGNY
jgi:hypothetical protein